MIAGLPARVHLTEVGPRDGLQNEPGIVPTSAKVAFVRALVEAGHRDIEVSSFVRPDVVPQLADAEDVFRALGPAPEGVVYGALVPNRRGLQRALDIDVRKMSLFIGATESFNRRNVNASIEDSLVAFEGVAREVKEAGVFLRGYVSMAFACPYEGPTPRSRVLEVIRRMRDLGCDEISVGDTIGAATPADVAHLLDALLDVVPAEDVVMHFHDTRGMAVANVVEGLRHGVTRYDASSGGLGGCPFAPGASGNLATEDVVYLLDGLGIEHGIDLERQRAASRLVARHVEHELPSRVYVAPPIGPRTAEDGR